MDEKQWNKTIRVSEEVYEELKKRAKPFKDTPDSVLRRVFDLKPKENHRRGTQQTINR